MAEARESAALGFDGKTLIHPKHIAACRDAFAPDAAAIERARNMVASSAKRGGAMNFEGEMVEAMHVASARRLLRRAGIDPDAPDTTSQPLGESD